MLQNRLLPCNLHRLQRNLILFLNLSQRSSFLDYKFRNYLILISSHRTPLVPEGQIIKSLNCYSMINFVLRIEFSFLKSTACKCAVVSRWVKQIFLGLVLNIRESLFYISIKIRYNVLSLCMVYSEFKMVSIIDLFLFWL